MGEGRLGSGDCKWPVELKTGRTQLGSKALIMMGPIAQLARARP
jgi:hypothetical protein